MLIPLLAGILTILVNMVIQVIAVLILIRLFVNRREHNENKATAARHIWTLTFSLAVLFAGNLVQITIWARLFVYVGEFQVFATAFYHSTVNFASLGYGDIVMSEQWRLLGALEAASGVLMFGLTAGTMFSIMQAIVRQQHQPAGNHNESTG
ncbi:MAG: two pore domain potassium channel family protein [Gammaproteobacteria bacterium]|nr:MAG: two pore domain potassium channel family protein [Gammaproteobacteria bacterium]RLA51786.1 MAG: two pore domain potassium channel family protein [Gammaproteobacteria bacterium]